MGITRWKSGTVAKREIRKLTRSTNLLFPKRPFQRLVREIAQDYKDIRFTTGSMQAIQEAAEVFVTETFHKADLARKHSRRNTLHVEDIRFSRFMTPESLWVMPDKIWEMDTFNVSRGVESGATATAAATAATAAVYESTGSKKGGDTKKNDSSAVVERKSKREREEENETSVDDKKKKSSGSKSDGSESKKKTKKVPSTDDTAVASRKKSKKDRKNKSPKKHDRGDAPVEDADDDGEGIAPSRDNSPTDDARGNDQDKEDGGESDQQVHNNEEVEEEAGDE